MASPLGNQWSVSAPRHAARENQSLITTLLATEPGERLAIVWPCLAGLVTRAVAETVGCRIGRWPPRLLGFLVRSHEMDERSKKMAIRQREHTENGWCP
jgi:hypothetical protein